MEDNNYLGHSFYLQTFNIYYIIFNCSLCDINCYYYIEHDLFTTDKKINSELILIIENGISVKYKKLVMSCGEMQIKNLLE